MRSAIPKWVETKEECAAARLALKAAKWIPDATEYTVQNTPSGNDPADTKCITIRIKFQHKGECGCLKDAIKSSLNGKLAAIVQGAEEYLDAIEYRAAELAADDVAYLLSVVKKQPSSRKAATKRD